MSSAEQDDATSQSKVCSPLLPADTIILLAKGGYCQTCPDPEFSKAIDNLQMSNVKQYYISPIEFRFVNTSTLQQALSAPHAFGGIILTSTRCVDAIEQSLDVNGRSDLLKQWSNAKIFTVGEATRNYLFDKLQLTSHGHHTGNSTALAHFILECNNSEKITKPLLYPCSNIRTDAILDLLRGRVDVKEIVCYETIPNQRIEQDVASFYSYLINVNNGRDEMKLIIIFFSPSGVECLLPHIRRELEKVNVHLAVRYVAFGKQTATKMTELGLNVWFVASSPTPQALVTDLRTHLNDFN